MPRKKVRTSKRQMTAFQKQVQALEMRCKGHSFQEIADALGYSQPCGAYQAVVTAMRDTKQEPADVLRDRERERLNRLIVSLWDRATKPKYRKVKDPSDPKGKRTIEEEIPPSLKALDRLIKLLDSLYEIENLKAPKRVHYGGDKDAPPIRTDNTNTEVIDWSKVSIEDREKIRDIRNRLASVIAPSAN